MKNNSVKFVDNNYDASVVLKAIATDIGKENIMGCVKTQGLWIVTLRKKQDVELLQETGLKVGDDLVNIVGVTKTILTVSVFGVPLYVDDSEITDKLEEFGCKLRSNWVHKFYDDFPEIENGIRFVRLEMPNNAKSLPYAIIVSGIHLRLKHNGQLRVCNLCLAEDHIMRDCPHYCCRSCGQQGHTASRCPTIRCYKCNKDGHKSFQCPENRKEDNVTVAGNPDKNELSKDEIQQEASPIVTKIPAETSSELNQEANAAKEKDATKTTEDKTKPEPSSKTEHKSASQPSISTASRTPEPTGMKRPISSEDDTFVNTNKRGANTTPNLSVARRFIQRINTNKT